MEEGGTIRKRLNFGSIDSEENVFRRESILSADQPVLTYLRIKPISHRDDKDKCMEVVSSNVLQVKPSKDSITYKNNQRGTCEFPQQFLFSHIFRPEASQKNVFNELSPDLLQEFFGGHDCLLFSYGVTNSGKTHTILGTPTDPGILPRTLGVIFNTVGDKLDQGHLLKPKNYSELRYLSKEEQKIEAGFKDALVKKATVVSDNVSIMSEANSTVTLTDSQLPEGMSIEQSQLSNLESASTLNLTELLNESKAVLDEEAEDRRYSIWVSCAEIYNEFIYDLIDDVQLEEQSKVKDRKKKIKRTVLKLAHDRHKNCYVKGLKEVKVESIEEVILLCKYAQCNRKMAATMLNYASSRSHCVFTVKLVQTDNTAKPTCARVNRISIVDLAGSERTAKTQVVGTRAREAGNINVSLMVLGRCIDTIRLNQKKKKTELRIVPFRESKLTQLFQNFFVGKGQCAGQGRVMLLVNVSPASNVFDETLQVLKFSAIANQVCPYSGKAAPSVEETQIQNVSKCEESEPEADNTLSHSSTRQERLLQQKRSIAPWETAPTQDQTNCWTAEQTYEYYIELYKYCEEVEHHLEDSEKENEQLFEEVKRLKLENFQQAATLRQQLWKEFSERFSVIQEEHKKSVMEREELMEDLYEKKIEILERNVLETQVYTRKKRKLEKERDEEEHIKQIRLLREEIQNLKHEIAKKDKEFTDKMLVVTGKQEEDLVSCNQRVNVMSIEVLEAHKKEEEAKKTVRSLEEKMALLKTEKQQLAQQKSSIQAELDKIVEELEVTKKELDSKHQKHNRKVSEAGDTIARLQKELDVTKEELVASRKQLTTELESLQQKCTMLENDVEDRRKSRASLLADCSLDQPQDLKEQLAHLTVDLKQEREEKERVVRELADMKESLEMQKTHCNVQLEQNKELLHQQDVLKTTAVEAEELAEECQCQLSVVKKELEKSNQKRSALETNVEKLTDTLEDEKRSHAVALKVAMEKADIAQAGLEAQLADQKKQCATLEMQLTNLQDDHKSVQTRVEKLAIKEANLKTEVKELTGKLKTVNTKHSKEIQCINGSHELEIGELNSKIRNLTDELSKKSEELGCRRKELENYTESYEQEVAIIEEKHKEEMKNLQEQSSKMQRSNSQHSLNEQNLSKELVDMNKKINKLKKDNQKLEAAKGKLETEVSTLSKELGKAKKTLSSEKLQLEKSLQLLRDEHQREVDEIKKSQQAAVQECTLECRTLVEEVISDTQKTIQKSEAMATGQQPVQSQEVTQSSSGEDKPDQEPQLPARKRRKTIAKPRVEARHHDGDGLPVVPFASDIPSSSSSQTIASDAKDKVIILTDSESSDDSNRRRTRTAKRKSRAVIESSSMDHTMPFVPDLESSSQIVDDTLSSEQLSRMEIDVTPAEAVKTRRNRRKKRKSSNAFTQFLPDDEMPTKIPRKLRKIKDENQDPSYTQKKKGTLKRLISQSKSTITRTVKRPLQNEEQRVDTSHLYDDTTPTPKKTVKTARKLVKKSQISGPMLHNSSVIMALSPSKSGATVKVLRSRTVK